MVHIYPEKADFVSIANKQSMPSANDRTNYDPRVLFIIIQSSWNAQNILKAYHVHSFDCA